MKENQKSRKGTQETNMPHSKKRVVFFGQAQSTFKDQLSTQEDKPKTTPKRYRPFPIVKHDSLFIASRIAWSHAKIAKNPRTNH